MSNDELALALAATLAAPSGARLSEVLQALERCPYCSKANPFFRRVWFSGMQGVPRGDRGKESKWAAYACGSCGSVVAAKGKPGAGLGNHEEPLVEAIFPSPPAVSDKLPALPREYLRQAFETLHAPDAAAMVAGSAVDAMLKHLGLTEGSLYKRIDDALEQGLLTKGMADWAHSVRLGSNRPRHVDKETPHVSQEDAKRSVDFAAALGDFLFVLTAQIEEAKSAAERVA
jgi:hypothetical protein